jgi:AcrR family transcriptional regulator
MRSKKQSRSLRRRTPKQARSRDTIDVILQATIQILEQEDATALNTNAIAERAGISVGTLYEYFPDREAILVAVAQRQLACDRDVMLEAITRSEEPLADRRSYRRRNSTRCLRKPVQQRLHDNHSAGLLHLDQ